LTSIVIGDLDNKTVSALRVLERFKEIKQEIVVDQSSFEDCIKIWKGKGKVPNLGLEINIYGPVSLKEIVGKALSDARVYLQSPLSMANGVALDNPHLIEFPNLSINSEARPRLRPTLSLTAVEISGPFEPDVCEVLEGLDQHESLNLAHADSCVISTLLEYDCIQRWGKPSFNSMQASTARSSFSITERIPSATNTILLTLGTRRKRRTVSCCPHPEKRSSLSNLLTHHRFQHKITRKLSRNQDQCLGGIVADEMGLGKTLMMLSNIVRTRKTASAFAHCQSGNGETHEFFSKATLILVPSACKCSHQLSCPTIYLRW